MTSEFRFFDSYSEIAKRNAETKKSDLETRLANLGERENNLAELKEEVSRFVEEAMNLCKENAEVFELKIKGVRRRPGSSTVVSTGRRFTHKSKKIAQILNCADMRLARKVRRRRNQKDVKSTLEGNPGGAESTEDALPVPLKVEFNEKRGDTLELLNYLRGLKFDIEKQIETQKSSRKRLEYEISRIDTGAIETRFALEKMRFAKVHTRIQQEFEKSVNEASEHRRLNGQDNEFVAQVQTARAVRDRRTQTLEIKFMFMFLPERLTPEERRLFECNSTEMNDLDSLDTDFASMRFADENTCMKCLKGTLVEVGRRGIEFMCDSCGEFNTDYRVTDLRGFNYADYERQSTRSKKGGGYKKVHHFSDKLLDLFGKREVVVPLQLDAMIEDFIASREKNKNLTKLFRDTIDHRIMRNILEVLQNKHPRDDISSFYNKSTALAMKYNKTFKPLDITKIQIAKINEVHGVLEDAFLRCVHLFRHKRKNFFSFHFVLWKICVFLGYTKFLPMLSGLKCRNLDLTQEEDFVLMCKHQLKGVSIRPRIGNQQLKATNEEDDNEGGGAGG